MEITDSFSRVLKDLREIRKLNSDLTERIVNIFSMEQFLKSMEIISLNEVHKNVFDPSGRILWTVGGRDHDYLVYPHSYCSCMDYNLHGIAKNAQYYCKHLMAQAIFENLDESRVKNGEKDFNDHKFKEIIKDVFKI